MRIAKNLLPLLSALSGSMALTFELSQHRPIGFDGLGPGDEPGPGLINPRTWFTIDVTFGDWPLDTVRNCSELISTSDDTATGPRTQTHSLLLDWSSRNLWVAEQDCRNCSWKGDESHSGYNLAPGETDWSYRVYLDTYGGKSSPQ